MNPLIEQALTNLTYSLLAIIPLWFVVPKMGPGKGMTQSLWTLVCRVTACGILGWAMQKLYSTGYFWEYLDYVATGDFRVRLGATSVLMFYGWLLYKIRESERIIYALLELAAAAVTAYASLDSLRSWREVTSWVPIAGAVYLVVRGMDNLSQGIKAAEEAAQAANKEAEEAAQAAAEKVTVAPASHKED